jgi:hypothetical protein
MNHPKLDLNPLSKTLSTPASSAPSPPRTAEQGSAYIVTLLVLFVLTIVGLSLTLVTQTEMLVGSQDRTTQRIFYAADAGLQASIASTMATFTQRELNFEVVSNGLRDRIEVSIPVPLDEQICFLCERNEDQDPPFMRVPFAITSQASRIGVDAGGNPEQILARQLISVMVEFTPIQESSVQFVLPDDQVAKVRF